jgi:hypothetical protein
VLVGRLVYFTAEGGIPTLVNANSTRSLARIDRSDLDRLARLAAEAEAGLFGRHPDGAGRYAGRLLCRALCQSAALHYVNEKNGVTDFGVWSFYAAHRDGPFPYRWRGTADYGPAEIWKVSRRPAIVHRPTRVGGTRSVSPGTWCRRWPGTRWHFRPLPVQPTFT